MNSPCRASSVGPTAMAVKDEKKEKGKWLKQFKTWLFASEPSTQTLQQHKKDSSRKSGLDPDDARGTPARLDTSIGAYQAKAIG